MLCKFLLDIHSDLIKIRIIYILSFHPPACNQVHNSSSGFIKSPNFPRNYPDNARCQYLIMYWDSAKRITLNFQQFSLEASDTCGYDFMKIFDGDSTSSTALGRANGYCGSLKPPTLTSTGNSILIVFSSDNSLSNSGFYITYNGKINLKVDALNRGG